MFLLYIYNRKTKIYCFFFSKSGLSLGWLVLCVCGLQLVVPAGLFNSHRSIPHRFLAGSPGQQQLPSPPPASFLSLCLARLLALLPLCFGYRLFDGVRVVLQKLNPVLPQQFSGQQLVLWKQVDKKKREKKDRKKGIKGKWQKNRAERESKNKTALSGKITVSDILNEIQFVSLYQRNCFFVTFWIITVVFQKQKWESAAAKALQKFLLEEVIGASLMYKGCKSVLASFSHVSNNYAILTK